MGKSRILLAFLSLAALSIPARCETIGEAKLYLDGAQVVVSGAVTSVEASQCYIEAPDRSAGIWVRGDMTAINVGDVIAVTGIIYTINGERVILYANVYPDGNVAYLTPLGMSNKWVGGSWFGYQDCASDCRPVRVPNDGFQYVWFPATGLNNTGLLIKTWGTVTAAYESPSGARWFYIDDGYGATADLGESGILVYSDEAVEVGDFVTATGISGVEAGLDDGSRLIRTIRPRYPDDVAVLREVQDPVRPFSDEFDSAVLDPRWAYNPYQGSVSTASNQGWLRLIMPENATDQYGDPAPYGPEVIQYAPGDWELEVKLRPDFSPSAGATQWVRLVIRAKPLPLPDLVFDYAPVAWVGVSPEVGRYFWLLGMCGTRTPTAEGTFYFRITKTGSNPTTVSISFDGVHWEKQGSGYANGRFFAISTHSENLASPTGKPFAVYVDYVRFTPLGYQSGGE